MVSHLGSASAILEESVATLSSIAGIGASTAERVAEHAKRPDLASLVDRQFARAEAIGARMLTLWDADFPEMLRRTVDPPLFLWVAGSMPWLERPCVAIVGTRTPTQYGRAVVDEVVSGLVEFGVCIVSGLAIGIDGVVHRVCLERSGSTIAVFGSGLDVVYPGRHRRLAHAIRRDGALVSEFGLASQPEAGNFPRRNRIISGLSVATLVVEARKTGGALITARNALDQNREVFAIPGPITSPQSSGCNALIQRGEAMLVTSAIEVAEALGLVAPGSSDDFDVSTLTPDERRLWEVITDQPKHVDQLCVESGVDIGGSLAALLRLECGGAVHQLSGSRFVRSVSFENRTRRNSDST